jgi:hypothetical protein
MTRYEIFCLGSYLFVIFMVTAKLTLCLAPQCKAHRRCGSYVPLILNLNTRYRDEGLASYSGSIYLQEGLLCLKSHSIDGSEE